MAGSIDTHTLHMNYQSNLSEVLSDLENRLLDLETSHQQHEDATVLVEDEVASQISTAFDDFDPAYHDILTLDMLDSEVKPHVQGIVDERLEEFSQQLYSLKQQVDAIEQVLYQHTQEISRNGERYLNLTEDLQDHSASLGRLREFVTRETWMDRVKGWFITLRNRVV